MNSRKLTFVTAALLVVALLGFAGYRQFLAPTSEVQVQGGGYGDQPRLGNPDAPVKLVLFENFLCDHCKTFEENVFPRIERDYVETGLVEVYYVNLAWGPAQAITAGLAGECAYRQNEPAFWDYKSALFAAQAGHDGSWATTSELVAIARRNVPTLDADALQACIEDERYLSEVQRDLDLGDYVGIQGTPSVVIGNQGFEAPSFELLAAVIDQQLTGRD